MTLKKAFPIRLNPERTNLTWAKQFSSESLCINKQIQKEISISAHVGTLSCSRETLERLKQITKYYSIKRPFGLFVCEPPEYLFVMGKAIAYLEVVVDDYLREGLILCWVEIKSS